MLLCLAWSLGTEVALRSAGIWEVQNISAIARRCGGVEKRGSSVNIEHCSLHPCASDTHLCSNEAGGRKWTLRKLKSNS